MANFYKGSEIKFAIDLQAQGFNMDDDDFDIEVASLRNSIIGHKNNDSGQYEGVRIFNEDGDGGTEWYVIAETQNLSAGDLRVIARAHIPDANAEGGIRTEIAVASLGKLLNP